MSLSLRIAISLLTALTHGAAWADASDLCRRAYQTLVRPVAPTWRAAPTDLDGLHRAFSQNLIPDFSDPQQVQAFLVYRATKMGDASTEFLRDSIQRMAKVQREHPDLSKHAFRPVEIQTATGPKTVRPLSFAEAPWRSCLGLDCSSRTYFEKAMEEPYHYFTLTDAAGRSDSHITLTLGRTQRGRDLIPAAFVDKIQNVPPAELPAMIEAIRRSVSADGYTLVISRDLGDSLSGLSNSVLTIEQVRRTYVTPSTTRNLRWVQVEERSPQFPNQYSRADRPVDVIEVPAATSTPMQLLEPQLPWRTKDLAINQIFAKLEALKSGSLEDKIQYLRTRAGIELQGGTLPSIDDTIRQWMTGPAQVLKLKNEALRFLLQTNRFELLNEVRKNLTPAQQGNLIQNWLQSPYFKAKVLEHPAVTIPMAVAHLPSYVELLQVTPLAELKKILPKLLSEDVSVQPIILQGLSRSGNPDILRQAQTGIEALKARPEQTYRGRAKNLEAELDRASVSVTEHQREPALRGQLRQPTVLSDGTVVAQDMSNLIWYRPGVGVTHQARSPTGSTVMHSVVSTPDDRVVFITKGKLFEMKDGKVVKQTPLVIDGKPLGDGNVKHFTADAQGRASFVQGKAVYLVENGALSRLTSASDSRTYGPHLAPDGRVAYLDLEGQKVRWFKGGKETHAIDYNDGRGFNESDPIPHFMTQGGTFVVGSTHGTVDWITPQGVQHRFVTGIGNFFNAHGMAMQPDGTVVVGRSSGHGVYSVVWLKEGKILHEMPAGGPPSEILALGDGSVRIKFRREDTVFARDGKFLAREESRDYSSQRDARDLPLPDGRVFHVSGERTSTTRIAPFGSLPPQTPSR